MRANIKCQKGIQQRMRCIERNLAPKESYMFIYSHTYIGKQTNSITHTHTQNDVDNDDDESKSAMNRDR